MRHRFGRLPRNHRDSLDVGSLLNDGSSLPSGYGHLELIFRQGKAIGLTTQDILCAEPIPTTMATLYSWAWMTREKSWIEGLAALTVTEWSNDDRLLADLGGGHASRMARRWKEELELDLDEIADFKAHAEADEDHSDMFLPFLSRFAIGEKEGAALHLPYTFSP